MQKMSKFTGFDLWQLWNVCTREGVQEPASLTKTQWEIFERHFDLLIATEINRIPFIRRASRHYIENSVQTTTILQTNFKAKSKRKTIRWIVILCLSLGKLMWSLKTSATVGGTEIMREYRTRPSHENKNKFTRVPSWSVASHDILKVTLYFNISI